MFYPISIEYVGPNQRTVDEFVSNCVLGECVVIQSKPGRTNSSREERTTGWLGATGDYSHTALGACETLEEARAAAWLATKDDVEPITRGTGYPDPFHDLFYDDEVIEVFPMWDQEIEWVDAGEWHSDFIDDYAKRVVEGEELDEIERQVKDEAENDGLRLFDVSGLMRLIERRADEIEAEQDEEG